jgi:hypothetical protein
VASLSSTANIFKSGLKAKPEGPHWKRGVGPRASELRPKGSFLKSDFKRENNDPNFELFSKTRTVFDLALKFGGGFQLLKLLQRGGGEKRSTLDRPEWYTRHHMTLSAHNHMVENKF